MENTTTRPPTTADGQTSGIAQLVTGVCFVVAVYLTLAVIHWPDHSTVAKIGFCLLIPGGIGAITDAAVKAVRRSR